MTFIKIIILVIYISYSKATQDVPANTENFLYETVDPISFEHMNIKQPSDFEIDMIYLLDLETNQQVRLKRQPSLKNSATKFLLEIYNDISKNEHELDHVRKHLTSGRQRRALREENFITKLDHMKSEKCNNIMTFLSQKISTTFKSDLIPDLPIVSDMQMGFNFNEVPRGLQLDHSDLRIYQLPDLGKYIDKNKTQEVTIFIYEKVINQNKNKETTRILSSVNTTTSYKGWLHFNITRTLNKWLQQKSINPGHIIELFVGAKLNMENSSKEPEMIEISASDLGLVKPNEDEDMQHLQPFIIGYFKGPEFKTKIQKLRSKRDVNDEGNLYIPPNLDMASSTPKPKIYKLPKSCDRLNLTINFKDLNLDMYVIAPPKLDIFFCGGECNFSLDSKMYATNHAILQTLMHSIQPNLPKSCCVPTDLSSINLLVFSDDFTVVLKKYQNIVVEKCGCH